MNARAQIARIAAGEIPMLSAVCSVIDSTMVGGDMEGMRKVGTDDHRYIRYIAATLITPNDLSKRDSQNTKFRVFETSNVYSA